MKFCSIFTDERKAKLWAVCYPEDEKDGDKPDIFTINMDLWKDTEYIQQFLIENEIKLVDKFWGGISPDEAMDQILDEIEDFMYELSCIENDDPDYKNYSLKNIFVPLHENIYSLNRSNEQHRKAKPYFKKPMIRLYAIELQDETLIITGGAIKLCKKMVGEYFEKEFKNLKRVQKYLEQYGIISREDLIDCE